MSIEGRKGPQLNTQRQRCSKRCQETTKGKQFALEFKKVGLHGVLPVG